MRNSRGKILCVVFGLLVGGYQIACAALTINVRQAAGLSLTFGGAVGESQRQAGGLSKVGSVGFHWLRGSQNYRNDSPEKQTGFTHKEKKHSEVACAECHTITRDQIDVKAFPPHSSCVSCHNFAAEMMKPANKFCGVCHESKPISKSEPALFQFPKPRTSSEFGHNFSHVAHLKSQPVEIACPQSGDGRVAPTAISAGRQPQCADCHRKIEPARKNALEMTRETGHAACFKCHCETPSVPTSMPGMQDCAKCHQIDGPKSPRLFNVVTAFRHSDHELDTRPIKKAEARNARPSDFLCAECHQAVVVAGQLSEIKLPELSQCNQCHTARPGLPDKLAKEVVESLKRR